MLELNTWVPAWQPITSEKKDKSFVKPSRMSRMFSSTPPISASQPCVPSSREKRINFHKRVWPSVHCSAHLSLKIVISEGDCAVGEIQLREKFFGPLDFNQWYVLVSQAGQMKGNDHMQNIHSFIHSFIPKFIPSFIHWAYQWLYFLILRVMVQYDRGCGKNQAWKVMFWANQAGTRSSWQS